MPGVHKLDVENPVFSQRRRERREIYRYS